MHTNGLGARRLEISTGALHNALANVAEPNKIGMGMVLNARGNVYGDVRSVPAAVKAHRRAKNKAARRARRVNR